MISVHSYLKNHRSNWFTYSYFHASHVVNLLKLRFANADPKVADQGNFETFPSFQDILVSSAISAESLRFSFLNWVIRRNFTTHFIEVLYFSSLEDFFYAHFETVRTAEDFQQEWVCESCARCCLCGFVAFLCSLVALSCFGETFFTIYSVLV